MYDYIPAVAAMICVFGVVWFIASFMSAVSVDDR